LSACENKRHLALFSGNPVRTTFLPYGRQSLDASDIAAVTEILSSEWLTTGPKVEEFEKALREFVGGVHVAAVSNGTAALHCALTCLGLGSGDEVIVPTLTFVSTANAVIMAGATPVFCDISCATLNIDVEKAESLITSRTKAIIAVDFGGQPCDYDKLSSLCKRKGLVLVSDASHSLGARYHGRPVGTLADITTFSFHPVKGITTGEGGAIASLNSSHIEKVRRFRNHGLSVISDSKRSWPYSMETLGYNYRISDIQCALGISQLKRFRGFLEKRALLVSLYHKMLSDFPFAVSLEQLTDRVSANHLYVIALELQHLMASRDEIAKAIKAEGIGVNVHYHPVHRQPFYQRKSPQTICPVAESISQGILTLPLFVEMTEHDVSDVVFALRKVCEAYSK
jgi:perosamine synthetase